MEREKNSRTTRNLPYVSSHRIPGLFHIIQFPFTFQFRSLLRVFAERNINVMDEEEEEAFMTLNFIVVLPNVLSIFCGLFLDELLKKLSAFTDV